MYRTRRQERTNIIDEDKDLESELFLWLEKLEQRLLVNHPFESLLSTRAQVH